MELHSILATVCESISYKDINGARAKLVSEAPFKPVIRHRRQYNDVQALSIYRRDGFIDRYSGEPLVFPGTLRLLSYYLPDAFPYHSNWHTSHTHFAYWEMYPTLDHIIPIARGGTDEEENWVTTSQLYNSAKGQWLLSELGWRLHATGNLEEWDGLFSWFLRQVDNDKAVISIPYIQRWFRAAKKYR